MLTSQVTLMIDENFVLALQKTYVIPPLEELQPWMTPSIARRGAYEEWLEPLVMYSLIEDITKKFDSGETYKIADLDKELKELKRCNGIRSNEYFSQWLKLRDMDENKTIAFLLRSKSWKSWIECEFKDKSNMLFLAHKDSLSTCTFGIIKCKSRSVSLEVFLKIQDKEINFHDAYSKYSSSKTLDNGGIVGPLPLESIQPSIRNQLNKLDEDKISEPFFINGFWYIIKLIKLEMIQNDKKTEETLLFDHGKKWLIRQSRHCINKYLENHA